MYIGRSTIWMGTGSIPDAAILSSTALKAPCEKAPGRRFDLQAKYAIECHCSIKTMAWTWQEPTRRRGSYTAL